MMSFARLSPFEKHCYKISPLLEKKSDIEEMAKNKFKNIREQIIEELNQKEICLLKKLNKILSDDVTTIVKQAFVKNEMMDLCP
jgi:sensor domain CHASE-containing protein